MANAESTQGWVAVRPSVLIVSDIRLYREGLARFLSQDGRLAVWGSAGASPEMDHCPAPEVVLLDLSLPDPLTTFELLSDAYPNARVLALGLPEVEAEVLRWAEAGIAGYVCREASLEELVSAVNAALQHELRCSVRIAGLLLEQVGKLSSARQARPHLTPREDEIVSLLEEGLTNKEIARRAHIEVATVKNHVHNILEKLGAETRGQAVAKARHLRPARARNVS